MAYSETFPMMYVVGNTWVRRGCIYHMTRDELPFLECGENAVVKYDWSRDDGVQ